MKPVLLLIPGMFNTAAIWSPVAALLAEQLDLRVADVSTQDSIAAMAADAWDLVAGLPAGTPLLVCGFSMGGYVAIELLAAHGADVHGAVFVDTSAQVETAESTLLRQKTITALERNFVQAVEGIISLGLHPDHHHDMALAQAMRGMMHAVGAQAAIRQIRALTVRADHRLMLSRLRIPVLVACGREDKVTPPALSQDLADLIPGARLQWMEHAGHLTPIEQPALLAQLLLALVPTATPK